MLREIVENTDLFVCLDRVRNIIMFDEPLSLPNLTGFSSTAEILKKWLIDEKKSLSGLIGVNDKLRIVSVRTFQHGLALRALPFALDEAVGAAATGIVVYGVLSEDDRPTFDTALIGKLAGVCEALNVTLLDVIIYSQKVPDGWLSARERNVL